MHLATENSVYKSVKTM